jgi:hypothetical protein
VKTDAAFQDEGVREAFAAGRSHRESYRSSIDGQWCLTSYVREPATGWVVGSACPVDLATAPMKASRAFHNTLTVLVSGISLLLMMTWRC